MILTKEGTREVKEGNTLIFLTCSFYLLTAVLALIACSLLSVVPLARFAFLTLLAPCAWPFCLLVFFCHIVCSLCVLGRCACSFPRSLSLLTMPSGFARLLLLLVFVCSFCSLILLDDSACSFYSARSYFCAHSACSFCVLVLPAHSTRAFCLPIYIVPRWPEHPWTCTPANLPRRSSRN